MQTTPMELQPQADGAVGSRGRWERLAHVIAQCDAVLRRYAERWSPGDDTLYLAAAHSLEDLEGRQRRLERDGVPLVGSFLP